MATVRKRKTSKGDISWQVQIRKKGYPLVTKTFTRKIDADRWAKATEAEMDARRWRDIGEAESTTLAEALDRYSTDYSVHKKGHKAEAVRISHWKKTKLAPISLAMLKGADFVKYRDARLAEGKAPTTVRLELALISHLFNMARKEWGLEGLNNPIQDIKLPTTSKARDRRFAEGEEAILMEFCQSRENKWIYPITKLALETGARRSELLKLEWSDVYTSQSTALLRDTKNGDDREIPLSGAALALLKSLPEQGVGKVLKTTENSFRLSWSRMMKQIEKQYPSFTDFRFHDLRHEATSRFFEKGLNIMEVASITGHKDLKMLKRYTHLKASDLAKKL